MDSLEKRLITQSQILAIKEKLIGTSFESETNFARWIRDDEGKILRELIRLSGATRYYESGTCNGYSACWAFEALSSKKGDVYTFDPVNRNKIWDVIDIGLAKNQIHYFQEKFSGGIGRLLQHRLIFPIAIFIDGDHGCEAITDELNAIKKFLRSGDLIVFHDARERKVGKTIFRFLRHAPECRSLEFKTRRQIHALFYDTSKIPAGDESEEPITVQIESEMDWETEKVKNIPEWECSEKLWVDYPEKALLSSSEQHLLYDTAKRLGSGNYANLGAYTGASAACLSLGLKQKGYTGKIYSVDDYTLLPKLQLFPERMVNHFKDMGIDQYLVVCPGTTFEWGKKLQGVKFKFVFIDAGHRYKDAKQDFMLWSPLVEVGGEIAFHDIEYTNVNKVIEEDIDYSKWELVRHTWRTKVFKKIA